MYILVNKLCIILFFVSYKKKEKTEIFIQNKTIIKINPRISNRM